MEENSVCCSTIGGNEAKETEECDRRKERKREDKALQVCQEVILLNLPHLLLREMNCPRSLESTDKSVETSGREGYKLRTEIKEEAEWCRLREI